MHVRGPTPQHVGYIQSLILFQIISDVMSTFRVRLFWIFLKIDFVVLHNFV
jgi:hypothetical protein